MSNYVYIRRPVYYLLVVLMWLAAGIAGANLILRNFIVATGTC